MTIMLCWLLAAAIAIVFFVARDRARLLNLAAQRAIVIVADGPALLATCVACGCTCRSVEPFLAVAQFVRMHSVCQDQA